MVFEGESVIQVLLRDVTLKKNYEEQLEYLAFHDPLTGLTNRRYFTEQINQAIETAQKENRMLAVMYIDIDKFKSINDSLGHEVGDQLLKQFASRLKENVREEDILCRVGGDEFLVLLNGMKEKKVVVDIVSRLHKAFQQPYLIDNHKIVVTSSMGIAVFPQDGINSKILISRSDIALYQAKEQRNDFQFYELEKTL
jgi:diguanylate cyclase (GGDEF)-like protein